MCFSAASLSNKSHLFSRHSKQPLTPRQRECEEGARTAQEAKIQSTNMHQIKAALWDQAFTGNACVSCPIGPVVAVSLHIFFKTELALQAEICQADKQAREV